MHMVLNIFHILDFEELNFYTNYLHRLHQGLSCLSPAHHLAPYNSPLATTVPLLVPQTPGMLSAQGLCSGETDRSFPSRIRG